MAKLLLSSRLLVLAFIGGVTATQWLPHWVYSWVTSRVYCGLVHRLSELCVRLAIMHACISGCLIRIAPRRTSCRTIPEALLSQVQIRIACTNRLCGQLGLMNHCWVLVMRSRRPELVSVRYLLLRDPRGHLQWLPRELRFCAPGDRVIPLL